MLKETENILRAFKYNPKTALEQYLTACEIDKVNPNPTIVNELKDYYRVNYG